MMAPPMTGPQTTLTLARVNSLLDYDPASGEFRWRVSVNSRARKGQLAGRLLNGGYRQIQVAGRQYYAHRLAWLVNYCVWPSKHVDHINGVRDDNRVINLRLATRSENQSNRGTPVNNTSGHKGIDCCQGYWRARIGRNHLGRFKTLEEAVSARLKAEPIHFGEFRR